MDSEAHGGWVAVALLGRTWGRRGELSAENLTAGLERFEGVKSVRLSGLAGAAEGRDYEVESVWEHKGRLIFKFRGIDSISDAEPLERAEVRLPAVGRPELPAGEYYQSDLVGCEVVERATRERLGVVKDWREFGGPPLLEVEMDGRSILVPFAKAICVAIDVAGRRIEVDLPDGLRDLG